MFGATSMGFNTRLGGCSSSSGSYSMISSIQRSSTLLANSGKQRWRIQFPPLGASSLELSNPSLSYSLRSHVRLHSAWRSLRLPRGHRLPGVRSNAGVILNRANRQGGPTETEGNGLSNAAALEKDVQSSRGADDGRWMQTARGVHLTSVRAAVEVSPVQMDTQIACAVLVGGFMWMRVFDFLTKKKILGQKVSRKIVHITSGLFYMMSWPFFSTSRWARFIAALVPLAMGLRLIIHGLGIRKDDGLVRSISRSGESRELLGGPLYYAVVLFLSTVLFWRHTPVGMISLAMMCGGDGIADIVGRSLGSKKLPYNTQKSYAGSIAMLLFGSLVSSAFLWYFSTLGFFRLSLYSARFKLLVVCLAATIVESLPISSQFDDNVTVPTTTFLLGTFLFHVF